MTHQLVVTRTFLNFARGDIVAEAAKVVDILSSDYRRYVIKIALPDSPKG